MNPRKIAVVATAFACVALLPVAGAQAAKHPHRMMHAHRHAPNPVAGAVDTAGALAFGAIGTAGAIAAAPFGGQYTGAGYYSPGTWGDFDCSPGYPGCRPYASKDWSNH
jgi:hypothetical protein